MAAASDLFTRESTPTPIAGAIEGVSYLGPVEVIGRNGDAIEIQLPNSAVVEATPAFSIAYVPKEGDVLLSIGGPRGYWAIGVIHGSGTSELAVYGDMDLRSVGGALRLSGDQGVVISGPQVDVETNRLRLVADSVLQKFGSLNQRVRDLFTMRAGRQHTVVDEESVTTTKRSTLLADESVTINGKAVMLG